jgi:hypothetical protein
MARSFCPRCARRHGVGVAYGFPGPRMERLAEQGEIVLGGCSVELGEPNTVCLSCRARWFAGPLPTWWPPRDLPPARRAEAGRRLRELVEQLRPVVELARTDPAAARDLPVPAADPTRGLEVAADQVLLAEVLAAAVEVCRAVATHPEPLWDVGRLPVTVADALRAFGAAEAELRERGPVDFTAIEADPRFARRAAEEDRLEEVVGAGSGTPEPEAGPSFPVARAADLLRGGSALGWARYLWPRLPPPPDPARAALRLTALARLRLVVLDLLDGGRLPDEDDGALTDAEVAVLAAAEGLPVPPEDPLEQLLALTTDAPRRTLVHRECERVAPDLLRAVGPTEFVALTWASRYPGARYPLSAAALGEAARTPGARAPSTGSPRACSSSPRPPPR